MPNASKPFKKLQDGFLAQTDSLPESAAARDISAYLERIHEASRRLRSNTERITHLEGLLFSLKKRQDETYGQLESSRKLAAHLEQGLATQTNRAIKAEALALSAVNHAKQRDQALADANAKLDALTEAIDACLDKGDPVPPQLRVAA